MCNSHETKSDEIVERHYKLCLSTDDLDLRLLKGLEAAFVTSIVDGDSLVDYKRFVLSQPLKKEQQHALIYRASYAFSGLKKNFNYFQG